MARPRIEIDRDQFQKLCAIQCTLSEIASWFKCSEDTIERWCKRTYRQTFADAFKTYSADGKISLRRIQFRMAEKSTAMAIWLGKQYLGQADKVEMQSEANGKLAELIDGLKENDLYTETAPLDGVVADKQA